LNCKTFNKKIIIGNEKKLEIKKGTIEREREENTIALLIIH
jgi:hypothetical protein